MSDDEEDFLKAMSDVTPLKREERVKRSPATSRHRDTSLDIRRDAAVTDSRSDPNTLSDQEVPPLDPWYVLDFKRPGVQNGVFRKFKQGRYDTEARLDLHRMTVKVARRELFDFLQEAYRLGVRCVLVVHGKGESGGMKKAERERSGILKGHVDHWLREIDYVQAFHSAQPRHGGTGAVYVLLQKSEEKKRENRERFMKGRAPYPDGKGSP
ncbi:MAG: DNA endonuclease SmrA [Halioglobus sp.]